MQNFLLKKISVYTYRKTDKGLMYGVQYVLHDARANVARYLFIELAVR